MTTLLENRPPSDRPTPTPSSPVRRVPASGSGRPWKRIIVDSVLLATFILSFASLALGNILWHVAAGSAFAVAAVVHTSLNRTWVRGVARRRRTIRGRARKNVVVNSILAVGAVAIIVSGAALWTGVLAPLGALHGAAAAVLIVSVSIHLVMHRRWIKRAATGPDSR